MGVFTGRFENMARLLLALAVLAHHRDRIRCNQRTFLDQQLSITLSGTIYLNFAL